MNQDLYNLTDAHISVLEEKYDYIVAPNQSIYPKKNIEYLKNETFFIEYSKYKKWHSFCSKFNKKIFPLTHFTFKDEFDYSSHELYFVFWIKMKNHNKSHFANSDKYIVFSAAY